MSKKALLSYADALAEIEEIIAKIENNEFSIDELAENVNKVSQLIKFCKEKLRSTEVELNNVLKHLDNESE